jgi:L-ascorbate metabolism protein UlaG (beta-lactamase superfamily)
MKRRELIGYAGAGLATGLISTFGWESQSEAQSSGSLSVQWLGHTCFLFTGGGARVLVNPFRTLGCTAKYRAPKVASDVVLISSQLLDEGAVEGLPGNPKLIYESGIYKYKGLDFQGSAIAHDRKGGKQFGMNTAWSWKQAGVNIVHLGVPAAPLAFEQTVVFSRLGRPDIAFIPVGGGNKGYTAQEAKQAVEAIKPKLVIPTHYRTQAADDKCDISPVDEFLTLMQGMKVQRSNSDTISINPRSLADTTAIQVMSYKF